VEIDLQKDFMEIYEHRAQRNQTNQTSPINKRCQKRKCGALAIGIDVMMSATSCYHNNISSGF
jgi:hypothetical protein